MESKLMEWMKDFFVWDTKDEGNTCALKPIQGFTKTYRLTGGMKLLEQWPEDVYFQMDPEFPRNIGLADNLQNLNRVAVISKSLRQFLENKRLKNVEYLPVAIMNHKGKIASRDYSIVNPILNQDCIDIELSKPTFYDISPGDIQYVEMFVIDPNKLDPDVQLFRPKNFEGRILIRAALANEISAGSFTGIRWKDPLKVTS